MNGHIPYIGKKNVAIRINLSGQIIQNFGGKMN